MTHGYMFSGSGSNVYVQNLCRALAKAGHDVHLLCQEPEPLGYDFVNEHLAAGAEGTELLGERETPYEGRCAVYNPRIGDLLPVYVYDDYPGWRVKTFLDLSEGELENYLESNAEAIRAVFRRSGASGAVTNHSVPGPEIAHRALDDTGVPYASIVHGSCLQYVARRSERYMDLARSGLSGASSIVALSDHSAGTIAEDFPGLAPRTFALPGGVDTDLFRPDALDPSVVGGLKGGPGRGPEAAAALGDLLARFPKAGGPRAGWPKASAPSPPPTSRAGTTGTQVPESRHSWKATRRSSSTSASSSIPRASTASSPPSPPSTARPARACS